MVVKARTSKADLLKRYADSQEDELFGDVEHVDFLPRSPSKTTSKMRLASASLSPHVDEDGVDTLRVDQLRLNTHNLPLFQLTPKNEESPGTSSPTKSNKSTKSTKSSGKRVTRDTLSEYSEENDTDITSEFSQDDFEGWDDCFSTKNDSQSQNQSIYQQMNQRLIARKVAQQKEAEREQQELMQLSEMKKNNYNSNRFLLKNNNSPNQTLKLKDPQRLTNENLSLLDQLENERTINYEYTRDDLDQFEDGFDDDFEESIQKIAIPPPPSSSSLSSRRIRVPITHQSLYNNAGSRDMAHGLRKLLNKLSMPSLARNNVATIKKFKSTMDLHEKIDEDLEEFEQLEQPKFNHNSKVIKKLDRIPSFYNKPLSLVNNVRNKNQILDQYKETKLPSKLSRQHHHHHHHHYHHPGQHGQMSKRMGQVRYLNNNSVTNADIPTPQKNQTMRFNKQKSVWEGNEVDLLRFEKKPSLITYRDIEPRNKYHGTGLAQKRQGNMLFDEINLRWVNLDDEEELNFDDIDDGDDNVEDDDNDNDDEDEDDEQEKEVAELDAEEEGDYVETIHQYNNQQPTVLLLPPHHHTQQEKKQKQKQKQNQNQNQNQNQLQQPPHPQHISLHNLQQPPVSRRGLSQFTQRTSSTATAASHDPAAESLSSLLNDVDDRREFKLSKKQIEKFNKEEQKIDRKINHWFIGTNEMKRDYYWEIRKMVTEE
ncbi:conserved hypothetical protein [Lodderomyces elongisporus NRRL YB-4239]|uniref:Uncharacterized protein n=1 Tax=Lodderomyces elongisporus (strain ATCC 11503 / CBS 2605 / JCM 1781 / NBRC 1676 / NRRL YB-4239) TaxID=379508 RepID=A5DVS7_LODEL|nr:conserved hypothetical protein [Lodderomyces elongisporus NRRL YB-4239]